MDDADDRAYARAPELEDVVALCRSLNAAGARYVLIGGFAVILHGFVRTTKDIDLLVDSSAENIRALKNALSALPDNAAADIQDEDVSRYGVVRVADEIVVDLMGRACGLTYQDAVAAGVDTFAVQDVQIPAASKSFLVKTKNRARSRQARRPLPAHAHGGRVTIAS